MSPPFDYRYVLDEPKRRLIVALVANGSSRRVAAHFVGCAPSTITRTAARDPDFAQQMAHAEQTAEIGLLRSVQKASRMPKHWRAAAWLLERRNPEDFAVRPPNIVTEQQAADAIHQIIQTLDQDLPEENFRLSHPKAGRDHARNHYCPVEANGNRFKYCVMKALRQ